jgi:hypothetical protein
MFGEKIKQDEKRVCDMTLEEIDGYVKTSCSGFCGTIMAPINFIRTFREIERKNGHTPISGDEFIRQVGEDADNGGFNYNSLPEPFNKYYGSNKRVIERKKNFGQKPFIHLNPDDYIGRNLLDKTLWDDLIEKTTIERLQIHHVFFIKVKWLCEKCCLVFLNRRESAMSEEPYIIEKVLFID